MPFDGTANITALPARLAPSAQMITDWNLALENGWYQGLNALNAPNALWNLGIVEAHTAGWVTQTVHSFTSDSSSNSQVWRRDRNNNTWGSWYRLQLTQEEQDTRYVKLTGNETIAGVKTFSSSPIVPTPTTDFQATTARSTNITVNVGVGQAYTTINQALEYLSGFYPLYKTTGVTATINLKAGFVMNEQVLVRGLNLGWITIVGEDAETIITHTALTTAFYWHYPAFGVDKGGTSPAIGQLFRFNVEKVGGGKHGLMTFGAGSSASVLAGKGFVGAGSRGIYADRGSTIDANSANASNAGGSGIYADRGSTIDADNANASNAGFYGIVAVKSSTINADNANASNAGGNGIHAANCSTINANGALVQNQTSGTARVAVHNGSIVNVVGLSATGGTAPVLNQAANTLTASGIIYQ